MIAYEERAYEVHVVLCLCLNFIRLALQLVCAHLIDKQMGTNKVLHMLNRAKMCFAPNVVQS
jgi:hypothetical protein